MTLHQCLLAAVPTRSLVWIHGVTFFSNSFFPPSPTCLFFTLLCIHRFLHFYQNCSYKSKVTRCCGTHNHEVVVLDVAHTMGLGMYLSFLPPPSLLSSVFSLFSFLFSLFSFLFSLFSSLFSFPSSLFLLLPFYIFIYLLSLSTKLKCRYQIERTCSQ